MKSEEAIKTISYMVDNRYSPTMIWGTDKEQMREVIDGVIDNTKLPYLGFEAYQLDEDRVMQTIDILNSAASMKWLIYVDDISNAPHLARSRAYSMLINGYIEGISENTVLKNDHIVIGWIVADHEKQHDTPTFLDRHVYTKMTHIVLDEASI